MTVFPELPRLLRALILPVLASGIGGVATIRSINTWYPELEKPRFNPPNAVFGPTWSTLYLLMGLADYIVERDTATPELQRRARAFYRLQISLNAAWPVLFFGRRSPLAGLVEIVALWFAIVCTVQAFFRISRIAGLLLIPYLLWVSFAALLNEEIWRLNRG
jgi:translocator protein